MPTLAVSRFPTASNRQSSPRKSATLCTPNSHPPHVTRNPSMAAIDPTMPSTIQVHRLPQPHYIDALRWLPPLTVFERFIVAAVFDTSSSAASVQTLALDPPSKPTASTALSLHSAWPLPSRISSLSASLSLLRNPLIAASTFSGSLHLLFTDPVEATLEREASVHEQRFHVGPISCVDQLENGSDCVTVGDDGRVNLVSVADSRLNFRRIWDSDGLMGYKAAKWGSPTEFATGGLGFSLQWWDHRKPGGAASQFKGYRFHRASSGIVHSIDIHQSRKHACIAAGSSGTIFLWDLRWQHQPIILSGFGTDEKLAHSPSESDVWKVQYDPHMDSLNIGNNISSSRILPAMICSEDGILAVVEEGEEPLELLAEPCAINSFDIDRQNPLDVICSLEWESIALVKRPYVHF